MKTIKVELYNHKSDKEIVLSFFNKKRSKKIKYDKLLNKVLNANDFIHIKKQMTIKEIIDYLENEQKLWAYCVVHTKKDLREIHYWFSKNRNLKIYDIASIFAHELAHAIGIKNEDTANKYAAITNYTLMILLKKF
jgi:hypothetical protein